MFEIISWFENFSWQSFQDIANGLTSLKGQTKLLFFSPLFLRLPFYIVHWCSHSPVTVTVLVLENKKQVFLKFWEIFRTTYWVDRKVTFLNCKENGCNAVFLAQVLLVWPYYCTKHKIYQQLFQWKLQNNSLVHLLMVILPFTVSSECQFTIISSF